MKADCPLQLCHFMLNLVVICTESWMKSYPAAAEAANSFLCCYQWRPLNTPWSKAWKGGYLGKLLSSMDIWRPTANAAHFTPYDYETNNVVSSWKFTENYSFHWTLISCYILIKETFKIKKRILTLKTFLH